tara:strand:+ start:1074 stop:1475 length:402 start_codon:yes stop_codon:yes gene_type:complete
MSLSMRSLKSFSNRFTNSIKSTTSELNNNDMITNIAIVLTIILSIGYISNQQYKALIFMLASALVLYLLCKNVFCALAIAIVITNLLMSMNLFNEIEATEENKEETENKTENENENENENVIENLENCKKNKN